VLTKRLAGGWVQSQFTTLINLFYLLLAGVNRKKVKKMIRQIHDGGQRPIPELVPSLRRCASHTKLYSTDPEWRNRTTTKQTLRASGTEYTHTTH